MENNILNNIENSSAYWDLVNCIHEVCVKAEESNLLYGDDIISAIDRVKTRWIMNHTQDNFIREMEETNEDED